MFWETGHFWEFQMKETKKVSKQLKEKTLAKETVKEMIEKTQKIMTSGSSRTQ